MVGACRLFFLPRSDTRGGADRTARPYPAIPSKLSTFFKEENKHGKPANDPYPAEGLYDLKEGVHIELKEFNKKIPDNLYETYSSFSNTDGGTIYLGIKEGKRNIITGVSLDGVAKLIPGMCIEAQDMVATSTYINSNLS